MDPRLGLDFTSGNTRQIKSGILLHIACSVISSTGSCHRNSDLQTRIFTSSLTKESPGIRKTRVHGPVLGSLLILFFTLSPLHSIESMWATCTEISAPLSPAAGGLQMNLITELEAAFVQG